jgi:hypothetical protein
VKRVAKGLWANFQFHDFLDGGGDALKAKGAACGCASGVDFFFYSFSLAGWGNSDAFGSGWEGET